MKCCRVIFIIALISLSWGTASGQEGSGGYTLEQCVEMALNGSHQAKSALREVDIARMTQKEAYTHYFPKVSVEATSYTTDNDLVSKDIDLGAYVPPMLEGLVPSSLSFSMFDKGSLLAANALMPIYAGGEIRQANRQAGLGVEVAELKQRVTKRQIILSVNTSFERVVNLREKLKVLSSVQSLVDTLQRDVKAAIDAGVMLRADLLRVELEQQRLKGERLTLNNAIAVCTMQLAQLVGGDMINFKISYTSSGEQLPMMPLSKDIYSVVLARDESRLLGAGVEAAEIEQRITLAKQLPKLGVGVGYMYNDLLGTSHNTGMLYVTLSIPISQWWGGSYAVKRSKLRVEQAQSLLAQQSEMMTLETRQVWSECAEAHALVSVAKQSVEVARENMRVVRSEYSAGTVNMSELLEAQLLYRKSMDQLNDAQSTFRIKALTYNEITK